MINNIVLEEGEAPGASLVSNNRNVEASSFLTIRPLTVEETFARVWRVLKKRWGVLFGLAAITTTVHYVLSIILMGVLVASVRKLYDDTNYVYPYRRFLEEAMDDKYDEGYYENNYEWNDDAWSQVFYDYDPYNDYTYSTYRNNNVNASSTGDFLANPVLLTTLAVEAALYYLIFCITDAASIRVVLEHHVGVTTDLTAALWTAAKRIGALIGTALQIGGILAIPTALLLFLVIKLDSPTQVYFGLYIIFMLYAMAMTILTYVAYAVVVAENSSLTGAGCGFHVIPRAIKLSEGRRGYLWGVLAIWFTFKILLRQLMGTTVTSYCDTYGYCDADFDFKLGSVIFGIVLSTVFAAIGGALQAVVYISLRASADQNVDDGFSTARLRSELGLDYEDAGMEASMQYADLGSTEKKQTHPSAVEGTMA